MLAAGLATIGIGKGPELEAKTVAVTLDPKELLWGTYGPNAIYWPTVKMVKLGDCETNHLQNILRTEDWHINDTYRNGICQILQERGQVPIPESMRCRTYEQRCALHSKDRAAFRVDTTVL
jgi:hypothetical protein